MMFAQSGLTFGPQTALLGVMGSNSNVFEVQTSLTVVAPAENVTFSAGGRSGPDTFTWCPGMRLPQTQATVTNCEDPQVTSSTTAGNIISVHASIRYQKTVAKFGGISQSIVGGGAVVVLRVPGSAQAPCKSETTESCQGLFDIIGDGIPSTAVGGGPIGNASLSPNPDPGKIYYINAPLPTNGTMNPAPFGLGQVTAVGAYVGPGDPNTVKSYGAPWTTGKVTLKANTTGEDPEIFYLQGSDNRSHGVGSISLVSGGVSQRSVSGDNANRGWINYVIGANIPVPAISNPGLVLLAIIFAMVTTWMIRRAMAPTS
jgi:hypothetical protein